MVLGLLLLLVVGSAFLSVATAPAARSKTPGVAIEGGAVPLENTNLPSMLLTSNDFGSGVESITSVPAGGTGTADTPPCLQKESNWHSSIDLAGEGILFDRGDEVIEGLGAFPSRLSAHQAFEQDVRALDGCHHFNWTQDGQTLSASISRGLPHVGKQGNELAAYRIALSNNGVTVGLDVVIARKGAVDMRLFLVPIVDDSRVPAAFTGKALARIDAPVSVSST
jgi:hypothetical protein